LHLDKSAYILLINTEGDTGPINYRQVAEEGKYPLPEEIELKILFLADKMREVKKEIKYVEVVF